MPKTPQTLIATVENFATAVVETSNRVPVLVDFWAPWCAPCRALVPVLDRIAQDYAGRLLLAKLNVDEEQEVAAHFGIRSIPTVLLIHRGQVVDQFTGVQPETTIRAMIERHVVGAEPASDARDPILEAHALARAGDHNGAVRTVEGALVDRRRSPYCSRHSPACNSWPAMRLGPPPPSPGSPPGIRVSDARDLRARLGFLEPQLQDPTRPAPARRSQPTGNSAARHALAAHHAATATARSRNGSRSCSAIGCMATTWRAAACSRCSNCSAAKMSALPHFGAGWHHCCIERTSPARCASPTTRPGSDS